MNIPASCKSHRQQNERRAIQYGELGNSEGGGPEQAEYRDPQRRQDSEGRARQSDIGGAHGCYSFSASNYAEVALVDEDDSGRFLARSVTGP
jgi:hypothetical protein